MKSRIFELVDRNCIQGVETELNFLSLDDEFIQINVCMNEDGWEFEKVVDNISQSYNFSCSQGLRELIEQLFDNYDIIKQL